MKYILILIIVCISSLCLGQSRSAKQDYLDAYNELEAMLQGRQTLSFKRAVFITENAFTGNLLRYEDFLYQIDALGRLTSAVATNDGFIYDRGDRQQVLFAGAIYRVMKDSLVFESPDKKTQFRNVPFTYDMDDFWGESDWTKMFVTKLLYEQTGNCHSLPALYKIIADEIGVKAWLAIAPNHTYIKQWSDKTGWYNTELTTGRFPYDKDIKWNSYIKSEAIADGIYMDTLSRPETISYVIADLAQGYVKKFGYDSLRDPIQWLTTALKYYPDYPNALILQAELLKKQYEQAMRSRGVTSFNALWDDKKMKSEFADIERSYQRIDQIGYRRMPTGMYLNWLFRINGDTTRKPYRFKAPQPFKQYNYRVTMATSGSDENFEFFDQDEIVRIGTVQFNRITGKIVRFIEPGKDDLPDEITGRSYDPAIGRWWQVDPLAEKRYSVNPYNFVQNNPINRVDPSGLTDFALNRKTGDVTQVGATNNDPDRIVKTNKNGEVKRKGDGFLGSLVRESKRGEAKVAVGGIQQGILKDGANFQNNHNVIAVGGEGQPTLGGMQDFALKISNYIGKEMGGYYLSNKGENSTSYFHIAPYVNNDAQEAGGGLRLDLASPDLVGKVTPTVDWHTHLSRFGDSDRLVPSGLSLPGGDMEHKRGQLKANPSLRFIIITNPSSTDQTATEIGY